MSNSYKFTFSTFVIYVLYIVGFGDLNTKVPFYMTSLDSLRKTLYIFVLDMIFIYVIVLEFLFYNVIKDSDELVLYSKIYIYLNKSTKEVLDWKQKFTKVTIFTQTRREMTLTPSWRKVSIFDITKSRSE